MVQLRKFYERAIQEIEALDLEALWESGLDRTLNTYYLIGTYPPLLAMEEPSQNLINELTTSLRQPIDLYLHFPFCKIVGAYECIFCHFYKESYSTELENRFIDACIKEMMLYQRKIGQISVRSIYFGGGSFSLISPRNLRRLLGFIQDELEVNPRAEIKVEIRADAAGSPQELNEQLSIFSSFNVTHLVIDIQSLNRETLAASCWQRICKEDYFETLAVCKDFGFKHFVTGLILGLPFDSFDSFMESVIQLATMPHINTINIFPLMFREGDLVFKQLRDIPEIFPNVRERDIMHYAARILLQAFDFVESPLYFFNRGTVPDHQASKFQGNSLLGIGPSAFGTFNGHKKAQYYNVPNLNQYFKRIEGDKLPIWRLGCLSEVGWATRRILFEGPNLNRPFNMASLDAAIRDRFTPLVEFFAGLGLLALEGDNFTPTAKGLLRAEELSYYLAEEEVQAKLHARSSNLSRYNYYSSRSHQQEELFSSAFKKFREANGAAKLPSPMDRLALDAGAASASREELILSGLERP